MNRYTCQANGKRKMLSPQYPMVRHGDRGRLCPWKDCPHGFLPTAHPVKVQRVPGRCPAEPCPPWASCQTQGTQGASATQPGVTIFCTHLLAGSEGCAFPALFQGRCQSHQVPCGMKEFCWIHCAFVSAPSSRIGLFCDLLWSSKGPGCSGVHVKPAGSPSAWSLVGGHTGLLPRGHLSSPGMRGALHSVVYM